MLKHPSFVAAFALSVVGILGTPAKAADTSTANLTINAYIPTVFSVTTTAAPNDIMLVPGAEITDRLLGNVHFRYNKEIANVFVKSSTTTGTLEGSGRAPASENGGFRLKFGNCVTINPVYKSPFTIDSSDLDVSANLTLTEGVEDNCDLTASWKTVGTLFPLGGKYKMTITLTMVSE